MKVNCPSCSYEVNLEHPVFKGYVGPVKCFSCGKTIAAKLAFGLVYSINPLCILNGQASNNLVETPKFTSQ